MRRTPHKVAVIGVAFTIFALATGGWLSADATDVDPGGDAVHASEAGLVAPDVSLPDIKALRSALDC